MARSTTSWFPRFSAALILSFALGCLGREQAQGATYAITNISDSSGDLDSFSTPSINAAGTVLFGASLDGGGSSLFTTGAGGGSTSMLVTSGSGFSDFGPGSISDAGTTVFFAHLDNGQQGIFTVVNPGDSALTVAVADSNSTFASFGSEPAINQSGSVVFQAVRKSGGQGLFKASSSGSGLATIVDSSGGFLSFSGAPALNNDGALAFVAELPNGRHGVYSIPTAGAQPFAVASDDFDNLDYFYYYYDQFYDPVLDSAGSIFFRAGVEDGNDGIFRYQLGDDSAIAMIYPYGNAFQTLGDPSINDSGTLSYFGSEPPSRTGIFIRDGFRDIELIAVGNPLFGSTITALDYSRKGMNNVGQAAFSYALADGRIGVAVASPKLSPPPTWEATTHIAGASIDSDDYPQALTFVGSDVVVTAASTNANGRYDYYTAKYAGLNGSRNWEQRFNGATDRDDIPIALKTDSSGNVIVTGHTIGSNGRLAFHTEKYAAATGARLWEKEYAGANPNSLSPLDSDDFPTALAVDLSGNVAVTGATGENGRRWDFYTAKYAGNDGQLLWEQRYLGGLDSDNQPIDSDDVPVAINTDGAGNVIVTGVSENQERKWDLYTAKYASASGQLLWDRRFSGPVDSNNGSLDSNDNSGTTVGIGMAVDQAGNVGIARRTAAASGGWDLYAAKYAGSDGHIVWDRYLNGLPLDSDSAPGTTSYGAVYASYDTAGNLLVAGNFNGLYVAKYAGANGALQWEHRIESKPEAHDCIDSFSVDGSGAAILVGRRSGALGTNIYAARFDSGDGHLTTENYLGGEQEGIQPSQVAGYAAGSVYASGRSALTNGIVTRKYALDQPIDTGALTLTVPESIVVEAAGPEGASVTYSVTAEDQLHPNPTVHVSIPSGSIFPIGVSTVNVTATNSVGNVVNASFTITVRDTTPPSITSVPPQTIYIGSSDVAVVPNYLFLLAPNDAVGIFSQEQTPASGMLLGAGVHTINFSVSDEKGNVVTSQTTLTVLPGRRASLDASTSDPTGTPTPESDLDDDVPAGSTIAAYFAPAISNQRDLAARVSLRSGRKTLGAIYYENQLGEAVLPAFQGASAPGISGVKFKSFGDPVMAPGGAIAFTASLLGTGISKGNDITTWTNAFGDGLQVALREGSQAPSLENGVLLKAVSSISLRDGALVSLLTLKTGVGNVTAANDTVLIRQTNATIAKILLRENDPLLGSFVKTISVLSPASGSPGHGRWQANDKCVAKVTLTDKRTVLVALDGNAVAVLLKTGDQLSTGETWAKFGLPCIGTSGQNFAALGTFKQRVANVSAKNDSAIAFSGDGTSFEVIAREGANAPDATGSTVLPGQSFNSFLDPLVNDAGKILFTATLRGAGIKGSNKSGLWWGTPQNVKLIARTGDLSPDENGVPTTFQWSAFVSTALPGSSDGSPIFVAKLSGRGVNATNNLGLWAMDSTGKIRLLIRTGGTVEGLKVSSFTLLKAMNGVFGAARSYNSEGSIALSVNFKNKTQSLLRFDLP